MLTHPVELLLSLIYCDLFWLLISLAQNSLCPKIGIYSYCFLCACCMECCFSPFFLDLWMSFELKLFHVLLIVYCVLRPVTLRVVTDIVLFLSLHYFSHVNLLTFFFLIRFSYCQVYSVYLFYWHCWLHCLFLQCPWELFIRLVWWPWILLGIFIISNCPPKPHSVIGGEFKR